MAKQSTTTVVLHDAHVAARAAAGAAFVAAYQGVCCFIAAVAVQCVARRAARADRAATRAANHAATKAANAVKVARKEAAEQYASRVARRAANKAANAPAMRMAKRAASVAAKLLKAANATRLAAVRAQRAANAAIAAIEAAKTTIDCATSATAGTRATAVVRSTHSSTANARATRALMVAFLAQTPCIVGLWFYATLAQADKAVIKAAAKEANKARAAIKAPRVPMNDAEKRAEITLACAIARKANIKAVATHGNTLSPATRAARAAQGEAAKAANALRKANAPAKVGVTHTPIVRSGPTKVKGTKRVRVLRVHTVESVMAQVAKKAATVKAKEDAAIAKAKKWAMRKAAYANRKAAMEVIAADAWMLKGVWLSEDLIRGANDWSYAVRINAFKEARNIAYAKAPVTQAVVAA